MAVIHGKIAFGTRVRITTVFPIPDDTQEIVNRVEVWINESIKSALTGSLGLMGMKVEFVESKVKVTPERIDP
jgi:hypothetical protein